MVKPQPVPVRGRSPKYNYEYSQHRSEPRVVDETMARREQGKSSKSEYFDETMVKRKRGRPPEINDSQPRPELRVLDGTMLRRKRGRPFKMNDLRFLPGIFRIYLPEYNSKQLVIPRYFVKNFNGKIFKNVYMRNLQGKTRKVELEQAGNKLLMKKGWEDFVIDNSLTRGEFLTFSYYGNVTFTVEIFSINGCKKGETTATNDHPHVDARGMNTESQDLCEVTRNVRERTIQSNNIRFRKVYNGYLYDLLISAGIFKTHNIVPPKLNQSETVLLQNQRGYSQEVKIWKRVDRVALSHGWREFQINNDIDKGDECEFEVILGEGRKIKEIILLQIRPTSP